jgi:hypothetical protein
MTSSFRFSPLVAALLTVTPALAQDTPASHMDGQWRVLNDYCMKCHNLDDFAGGLSLEGMGPDTLLTDGAQWEEVIRKLNAGMMPPVNQDQPTADERAAFVAALESALDTAVAQNPKHGSVVLHRLNRTEYANAIRDILGVEIDPADLLPRDDESSGFDNIANVLKVSPSFLEQYVLAAREVSMLALGNKNALPTGRVYPGAPEASQNRHVDGLPLGTRGGMLVEHHFPADGEYEFSVAGLVGAGYVWGVMDENTLIITIDDQKIFEAKLGDRADLRAVDIQQAEGVGAINDRFKNIRRFVTAGPHRVGVTFVARSSAEQIEPLHGFVSVDGMAVLVQGVSGGPRMDNITIRGPFNAVGVSNTPSRSKLFVCVPEVASEEAACATRIFANVARQAFRRPVSEADLGGAMEFYEQGRAAGADFEGGIQKGLMAILASPHFLYRAHTPPADLEPGATFAIKDLELASRLSFFIWSSQPDDALLEVAAEGRLSNPQELQAQVRRMLQDPKANALVTNFAFQWLNVKGMEQVNPDRTIFPQFTYDLIPDFTRELELFIGSIFSEDRPVTELLTANHTFLNERLSLHYGTNNVRGGQFQRVTLHDTQRFGLFGKGAVLMTTSYANRTSPVIRGAYILNKLLGTPPPSPPPNVEAFPEIAEGAQHVTVRERLEMHRDNPACQSCHAVIDPLGLALENYNAVGQWRAKDEDAGIPIDASGQLTDGTPVNSPSDLWQALVAKPERFAQTFTEKLLTFALGRELQYYDMPTLRKIVRDAADEEYTLSALVLGIVQSPAFTQDTIEISEAQDSSAEVAQSE